MAASSELSAAASRSLEGILLDLNMQNVVNNFKTERIDLENFLSLSEQQLIRLGINTIGDRLRLTERVKSEICVRNKSKSKENDSKSGSLAFQIASQRNALFGKSGRKRVGVDSRTSTSAPNKKGSRNRTWTVSLYCLSKKDACRLPSIEEKTILINAGLGAKKIQFNLNDDEAEVLRKISSEDRDPSNGETVGFPQLKNCGGFELLNCKRSGRELEIIKCSWNIKSLKSYIGNQAKIYIRPIQNDVDTTPIATANNEEAPATKIQCENCNTLFSVRELRSHILNCNEENTGSTCTSGDELQNSHEFVSLSENDFISQSLSVPSDLTTFLEKYDTTENVNNVNNVREEIDMELQSFDPNSGMVGGSPSSTCIQVVSDEGSTTPREESLHVVVSVPSTGTGTAADPFSEQSVDESSSEINEVIRNIIEYCVNHEIENPVEILRCLQTNIVRGRCLEIKDVSESIEGETNFIMVDRNNLLETGFDEINSIDDGNLRTTLEVQFYNETAVDHGGPRKEFFRLMLSEIKRKYFDNGLREHLASDYMTVGKIMSLSILQNGKVPCFMEPVIIEELFSNAETSSECIKYLRQGLDSLGLVQVGRVLPMFVHLLRPTQKSLTLKAVVQMLKPSFSDEGSNSRHFENNVYALFMRYLRAVASGRRGAVSLNHILQFATGATEEPVLGFTLQPSIEFVEVHSRSGFFPTANTCINSLKIPRPSMDIPLPPDEQLFSFYDYAFLNTFYGLY